MPYEFKLPDLGEGLTEGEVARWLVAEGDEIAEDQPLVEIQTDKTTVEIPSPAAGKVTSIRVAAGDVVPVGTVLVVIGGEEPSRRRRQVTVCYKHPRRPRRSARSESRRRRSCGGSPQSWASTSRPSIRPARADGSPRTMSGPLPDQVTVCYKLLRRGAAKRSAVSGGRSSSI